MSDKIKKRKVFPPENISRDEKDIFNRVEPFVINGLISVFGLDCAAQWKLTETFEQDQHFSLFARTNKGEVNLGEYPLSTLKRISTQEEIDDRFKAEFMRVNDSLKEIAP